MAFARFRVPSHTRPLGNQKTACVRPAVLSRVPAFSQQGGMPTLSPQPRRDPKLVKDVAKLGLLMIMKAMAATKLYQASAVRTVANSTMLVMKAVAPHATHAPHHEAAPQHGPPVAPTEHVSTEISPPPPAPESTNVSIPTSGAAIPTITITDTLLEAALWTDELRHMQDRRTQLQADFEQVTQHLRSTSQHASTAIVSTGPEFCTLTCQVEACTEVEQLRKALRSQIHVLSSHLVSQCASVNLSPPPLQLFQMQFMDRVLDPPPLVHPKASSAQVKELQRQWNAAAQDVTHLLVRLVQLRQLPAQPKARVTMAYVKEQVLNDLHDRQAYLAQDD